MTDKNRKNGLERVAYLRVHGVLPQRYHMRYRSGQEQMISCHKEGSRKKCFLMGLCTLAVVVLAVCGGVAWQNSAWNQNLHEFRRIIAYEDLYQYFKYYEEIREEKLLSGNGGYGCFDVSSSDIAIGAAVNIQQSDATAYLGTNLREKEIGEGDYSVTDGKYLYTAYRHVREKRSYVNVTIYQMEGEKMILTQRWSNKYGRNCNISTPLIYVYDDVMALVYTIRYDWEEYMMNEPWNRSWKVYTHIEFYDISDRSHIQFLSRQIQNGVVTKCREADGCLYVSSFNDDIILDGIENMERYVPGINGRKIALQDIYMQRERMGNEYNMISSWDLSSGGTQVDVKALVGKCDNIYMTAKNIYLCNSYREYSTENIPSDHTQIIRLSCEKGKLHLTASTTLPGIQSSSFSIQEAGNELWVTLGVEKYGSEYSDDFWSEVRVYAFDKNLKELDHLEGLAKNENIDAVRYIGQTGYFVSYETVDLLVRVDFSDSHHLKVLDELEMPGFSSYLHPVQDGLLLGAGRSDDGFLKLDLYDVSDPGELIRLQKIQLKERSRDCSLLEDYKWGLVDEENQLFGFSAWEWDEENLTQKGKYYLYHYDRKDGLQLVKKIKLKEENTLSSWKGFRVGEYLYLVEYDAERDNIMMASLSGEISMYHSH